MNEELKKVINYLKNVNKAQHLILNLFPELEDETKAFHAGWTAALETLESHYDDLLAAIKLKEKQDE